MNLSPGTRLGPYEIVSPLGAGGMGEVYRARDAKLKREVAIKVLPESLAKDEDALARFEKEALAVAALSHPNILAIFDFGTDGGVTYAVTELLEGATLRDRLEVGPIAPKQAVEYAIQIAKGLSAAHEKGIIHRDLKPENLFIAKDGHLKILDFGLAKRTDRGPPGDETSAPTTSRATEAGAVMGTVEYMSPEQAKGLPVDHRSDIFSFGVVLYEMLSGKKAFKRASAAETLVAILKEEPPELPEIPPALDRVVRHCLEKSRDDRFQSARDIRFALGEASSPDVTKGLRAPSRSTGKRALLTAAAVVVLIVGAIFVARQAQKRPGGATGVKRLAVLPFENLGSPEDDYFADGIADEIRSRLTSLPGIEVIARASSTTYKKTAKTPKQIADELEVKYLLTATVRWQKAGGTSRVHVTPELVEVKASGAPASRWQQPFDAALTDVFQVQADVATRVAAALGVALGASQEKRLSERPTENLAAYDAFLKGEEASDGLNRVDGPSLRKAVVFYEQAVALDPTFAPAWGQLARATVYLYAFSRSSPERAERAGQAIERALTLAPDRMEGHLAMALYRKYVIWDNAGAYDEFLKAHEVAPGAGVPLMAVGFAETTLGQWEKGLARMRQAERLDPRSVLVRRNLERTLRWMRRYKEAHEVVDRGLAIAPGNVELIQKKALIFLSEGRLAEARQTLHAAEKNADAAALLTPMSYCEYIWALDGAQLDILQNLPESAFDSPTDRARVMCDLNALRGDKEKARSVAATYIRGCEERLRAEPRNVENHAELGLALARAGRKMEAMREGELAVRLLPASRDGYSGSAFQAHLVRIYILVGEPEKALDQLEQLLHMPFYLSSGWLKIDPTFDSLRGNPRFQKLVAEKSG